MQSKLFLATKLLTVLPSAFSPSLPPAEGIRETVLHSDTRIQASSANLNSKAGERMISYAEVISKNNSGLQLPDPSIMLFVGVSLIGLAVWAKHRVKRAAR